MMPRLHSSPNIVNDWPLCGVTLLVLAPFWFAYLLLYEELRPSARYAVCNSCTDQVNSCFCGGDAMISVQNRNFNKNKNSPPGHSSFVSRNLCGEETRIPPVTGIDGASVLLLQKAQPAALEVRSRDRFRIAIVRGIVPLPSTHSIRFSPSSRVARALPPHSPWRNSGRSPASPIPGTA